MPHFLFQLIRTPRHGLAVVLALVVALRVVAAPVLLAAPEPGMIAVCAGGQIYYVTLNGDPVEGEAHEADPCPFLGLTLALGSGVALLPAPQTVAHDAARPLPQAAAISARRLRANAPRAPPFAA